ncbi:hypothetical protein UAJ10_27920 [Nitrospirillum sp. BR 11164]|uniref:hypothetical protein n=1 Tax=Nitrospirillum sp. BR 11164 TaxID=3104324 RepID=UPI002B0025FC|nr:hypothetical protein [Nitrospirillum sp. BR 11164]MEA1652830.1 hypothetical protein [Nitrospirillum sp. BR 11164]
MRTVCFSDFSSNVVIISILDRDGYPPVGGIALTTAQRTFDRVLDASILVSNPPFKPFVCSVLGFSQLEIDAGWAEIRVSHRGGEVETAKIRIAAPGVAVPSSTAFSKEALRVTVEHLRASGLPLARALAFGNLIAASAATGAASFAGTPPVGGDTPADPVAATISPHFDADFYRATYPSLLSEGGAASAAALLRQYCEVGWRQGRNPSSTFDTAYYLAANPDVAEAGVNPFWHYIVAGREEGRRGCPTDRHRRAMLRILSAQDEKIADVAQPPLAIIRISRARLTEALSFEGPVPAVSGAEAPEGGVRGVVVAIDLGPAAVPLGGRDVLIRNERRRLIALGYRYIHLRPGALPPPNHRDGPAADGVEVSVDGVRVGVSDYAELAHVLAEGPGAHAPRRLFTVHGIPGHDITGVIAVQRALRPTRNWFWIHDFSSLCANPLLLRNDLSFCGAPPPESPACGICLYGKARRHHLPLVTQLFNAIDFDVIAPSRSALALWQAAGPLRCSSSAVRAQSRLAEQGVRRLPGDDDSPLGLPDLPVRVAFVGSPSFHTGWEVFEELVQTLQGCFSYRFHHIAPLGNFRHLAGVVEVPIPAMDGPGTNAPLPDEGAPTLAQVLAGDGIDLVLVPTVLPETVSFVVHEAAAAGADVVALADSGDVADAILGQGCGRVFASDRALLDFFTTFEAVAHVRDRLREGVATGRVEYGDATASVVDGLEGVERIEG